TQANNFEPTTAALNNFKAVASSNALQMLNNYPPITSDNRCPGQPDPLTTGFPIGCLSFSDPVTTTTDSYYGRVDQNFSSSDRLSFTANVSRFLQLDKFGNFTGSGGSVLANFGNIPGTVTLNNHNLAVIETHTFNARV